MTDRALRRTVRRCVAVLLVPLTLLTAIPITRLQADGVSLTHPVLQFADEIALVVLACAVFYLVGSVVYQFAASSDGESRSQSGRDIPRV